MTEYIVINPQPPWDPESDPAYNVLEGGWFAKHRQHPSIIHFVLAPETTYEPIFVQGLWHWRTEK